MKLLVTGGTGLFGSELVRVARSRDWSVAAPSRSQMDIIDKSSCLRVFEDESPDCVVHCAAFTAVDQAEKEWDQVMRVNRDGSENVARAAALSASRMVHISTDYVFDGLKRVPYGIDESPSPLSVYAESKVAAEMAVMAATSGPLLPLIVRTGWLYGHGRKDFVDMVLENGEAGISMRVVDDQWGCPTWTRNLAETVLDLIELQTHGIVNVRDRGKTTWYGFAKAVLDVVGIASDLEGVSSEIFAATARRPLYSVLDLAETEVTLKRTMMPWPEALRLYMSERG